MGEKGINNNIIIWQYGRNGRLGVAWVDNMYRSIQINLQLYIHSCL